MLCLGLQDMGPATCVYYLPSNVVSFLLQV